MRRGYGIALVLLLAFSSARADDGDMSASDVFQIASRSVVVVETYDAHGQAVTLGSGVVVAPGVVVTNCHVYKGATVAQVSYQQQRVKAALRDADEERDLCTFTVDSLHVPAAQLGSGSTAKVGDRVYAIGAPAGLELTLSDGLVSSLRPLYGGNILQVTAPISRGSSGGGLFDTHARLIGITTMYLDNSQQLNFAMPVEWISELPQRQAAARAHAAATNAAEKETAANALARLAKELEAADPDGYKAKLPQFLEQLKRIKTTMPSGDWVVAARDAYARLQVPTPAPSPPPQRWKWVGTAKDGSHNEIDTETLKRDGQVVHAWIRTTFPQPQVFGTVSGVSSMLTLETFDCGQRTARGERANLYDAGGNALDSSSNNQPALPVVPDSIGEDWFNAACALR